jgi:hypothetical protein
VNSSDGTLTERRVTLANLRTATGLVIGLYVTMQPVESRTWSNLSASAGGGEAVGDGIVALATRSDLVVWKLEQPRDCGFDIVGASPAFTACQHGKRPKFFWD